MKNILQTLYARGVSVVLKGHDHDYERFALQNPEGDLDPAHGFRAFVVGTGGAPLRPLEIRQKNSEFFQADKLGVLKLDLYSDRYAWEFLPVGGNLPLDTGTGSCVVPKKQKVVEEDQANSIHTWKRNQFSLGLPLHSRVRKTLAHDSLTYWNPLHLDETLLKVKRKQTYLYRAVDRQGRTVDFLLRQKRDQAAAVGFLCKATTMWRLQTKLTLNMY